MSPAPNPYIVGPPIGGESGFFGRDEILQEIKELLLYPNKNSVILYGQRRSGKTSLLLQLERRLPRPPFFAVYFDLADKALLPVHQVLYEMAAIAAAKAGMSPPAADMFENNPDAFHEQFLPTLYEKLGRQQQPIFLLDEFNPVAKAETELAPNAAARALDDYLYGLLTTQSYTDFVFAAGRRMAELSQVVHSSYRADLARFVPVLNPDQARALILQDGAPTYDEAAIDQILALTRGHPFFTQQMCHALFEQAVRQSPQKPHVTAADVEAVMPVVLNQNTGAEVAIWDSIPFVERLTLAAIAGQVTQPGGSITEAAISNAFSQARIPPSLDGLGRAPENLVNWQMLAQSGNGYSFFVDYVRCWVAYHRPLELVKKRGAAAIVLPAAALLLAAQQAMQAGNTSETISQTHQLLATDPNNVQARLLLATALQTQGQPAEAIKELEAAYHSNHTVAAAPLAAALIQHGQQHEATGDDPAALAAYRRAATVDPNNKTAQSRRDAVQAKVDQQAKAASQKQTKEPQPQNRLWLAVAAAILLLLLCAAGLLWGNSNSRVRSQEATAAAQRAATQHAEATKNNVASKNIAATTTALAAAQNQSNLTADHVTATAAMMATEAAIAVANAASSTKPTATPTTNDAPLTPTPISADNAPPPTSAMSGQVNIEVAPVLRPVIEAAATAFNGQHPDVEIVIEENATQSGLEGLQQGTSNIALITREISQEEAAVLGNPQVVTLPSQNPAALVAHMLVPANDLTTEQVQDIFAGNITNWNQLGGRDVSIVVVVPARDAASRTTFEQEIMGDAGPITSAAIEAASDVAVRNFVASRPYAIGVSTFETALQNPELTQAPTTNWAVFDTALLEVKTVAINGVAPTFENVFSGSYPLAQRLNLVTQNPPDAVTRAWIEFLLSPEGQRLFEAR